MPQDYAPIQVFIILPLFKSTHYIAHPEESYPWVPFLSNQRNKGHLRIFCSQEFKRNEKCLSINKKGNCRIYPLRRTTCPSIVTYFCPSLIDLPTPILHALKRYLVRLVHLSSYFPNHCPTYTSVYFINHTLEKSGMLQMPEETTGGVCCKMF